jgi:hypothetical protein
MKEKRQHKDGNKNYYFPSGGVDVSHSLVLSPESSELEFGDIQSLDFESVEFKLLFSDESIELYLFRLSVTVFLHLSNCNLISYQ